ncbi:hypothetical protein B0H11DRAFT_2253097 [Mycena galericulata]|nr:hypothetical protein B0H11DRAFT_2253097 [Mycena galericulata]
MPDASTQTDQNEIDTLERQFKQEAITYLEGSNKGPPSGEMLRWLMGHLKPQNVTPAIRMELDGMSPEEREKLRKTRVDELIEQPKECATCAAKNPSLRCLYCFDAQFLCSQCMVEQHAQNPLHRIEILTISGLAGVTLKGAGLRIQLGHRLYDFCPNRIPDNNFVILDTDGLHEVSLDYCGCTNPVRSRGRQLRDAKFFPAGDENPRTAVAFKLAQVADGAMPTSMRVYHRRRPQ